ncbi:14750_t:CDS:1, partial [Entrophospora sp. SA101]
AVRLITINTKQSLNGKLKLFVNDQDHKDPLDAGPIARTNAEEV